MKAVGARKRAGWLLRRHGAPAAAAQCAWPLLPGCLRFLFLGGRQGLEQEVEAVAVIRVRILVACSGTHARDWVGWPSERGAHAGCWPALKHAQRVGRRRRQAHDRQHNAPCVRRGHGELREPG